MIGLDTNLLVRYVVRDDPLELAKVDRLFERELGSDRRGFINLIVLAELIWVLSRTYRFSRAQLTNTLAELLEIEALAFEHEDMVVEALDIFRNTNVDCADILINLLNHAHDCETTATLDQRQRTLLTARVL